jgi:hypothetical protein
MEADEHILQFERERFRLITASEEVAATAGGLGGLLGSVVTDICLAHEPVSSVTSDSLLHFEYQIGAIIGSVTLTAFVAAAVTSGVRYVIHRHKVNFKSDVTNQELREWYESPSASASKDV